MIAVPTNKHARKADPKRSDCSRRQASEAFTLKRDRLQSDLDECRAWPVPPGLTPTKPQIDRVWSRSR